jgi:hypothetical protein
MAIRPPNLASQRTAAAEPGPANVSIGGASNGMVTRRRVSRLEVRHPVTRGTTRPADIGKKGAEVPAALSAAMGPMATLPFWSPSSLAANAERQSVLRQRALPQQAVKPV